MRSALSRELIARTALALTDEVGLAGLSMRKLGNELGVEAMSLYHYVVNKDDLLDAVLDCLFDEIELPVDVPDGDWETAIRRGLRSFHDVLVNHQAALELFAARPAKSRVALDVLVFSYGRLQSVGLDVEQACHALHFGVSFVMGHAANELGSMAVGIQTEGLDPETLNDPVALAYLDARRRLTSTEMFDAGLETVVAGLRQFYGLP